MTLQVWSFAVGTLLDGEPIISLPPKSVELRKVEFSQEERDFYSKLEADSRAQFQVWSNLSSLKGLILKIFVYFHSERMAVCNLFSLKPLLIEFLFRHACYRNMLMLVLWSKTMWTFYWCFCALDKLATTLCLSSVTILLLSGNLQLKQQWSFLGKNSYFF